MIIAHLQKAYLYKNVDSRSNINTYTCFNYNTKCISTKTSSYFQSMILFNIIVLYKGNISLFIYFVASINMTTFIMRLCYSLNCIFPSPLYAKMIMLLGLLKIQYYLNQKHLSGDHLK